MQQKMESKVDFEQAKLLHEDKLCKDEVHQYLPEPEKVIKHLEVVQGQQLQEMKDQIVDFRAAIDSKMVKLRQQFDINAIRRDIDKKLDVQKAYENFNLSENRLRQMDSNVLLMAADFEKFQKIIAKVHKEVQQLMEINQDVLLGKKNTNCLSCNNGKDNMDKFASTKGKDGRIYYGVVDRFNRTSFQHRKTHDNNSEITKVFVDFNLNSGRQLHSPLQKSGGSPKEEKGGMFDMIDDRSATMNNKTNNNSNSSLTQLERYNRSYKNRHTSNATHGNWRKDKSHGSSSRQLNIHNYSNAQSHQGRNKKQRLPISYVI
jgi:hypothetical protein